ncbi:hypothetical protein V8J36_06785 [Frigidibacter sp. MR17.14]|uniref:hypothetical protein n=1 Tax=Frigidibacter sp. MR17.14 TaxID=3126509 RepID=UPI003012EB9C
MAALVTALATGLVSAARADAMPPITGERYVDSNGCAFQRATMGNRTIWAPVVGSDRNPMCGRPATVAGSAPKTRVARVVTVAPSSAAVVQAADGRVFCPRAFPMLRKVPAPGGGTMLRCMPLTPDMAGLQLLAPPKGYKRTWEDGRLNPARGLRTSAGDASMARYWTDEVPMRGKLASNTTPRLYFAPAGAGQ